MKEYTLGVMFTSPELNGFIMLKKSHPDWMKGKWNFPGGEINFKKEQAVQCMVREFEEETGMTTAVHDWYKIGVLQFKETVIHIFTCMYHHSFGALQPFPFSDEQPEILGLFPHSNYVPHSFTVYAAAKEYWENVRTRELPHLQLYSW